MNTTIVRIRIEPHDRSGPRVPRAGLNQPGHTHLEVQSR